MTPFSTSWVITMQEIVTSVGRVTGIMEEIAGASVEQSTGIDQVNKAVTQMDEVTQQNSALVEQAAAASESLLEQAESLMRNVSLFKLSRRATLSSVGNPANVKAIAESVNRRPHISETKPRALTHSLGVKNATDDEWVQF